MKKIVDFFKSILYDDEEEIIEEVEVYLEQVEPDGTERWLGADANGISDDVLFGKNEKEGNK